LSKILENIAIAFSAIRMNMLRAILTIFIIGFGIMSLISMLTAVDGMKEALYSNFEQVGSNTFSISNSDQLSGMRRRGMQVKANPEIQYSEALSFKKRFEPQGISSISFTASHDAVIQYQSNKTSPKTQVFGTDENYILLSGMQLSEGRNFIQQEISNGHKVAIIGNALKNDMFGTATATGKYLLLNNQKYLVIGTLQKKGSSFGQSQDDMVMIPVTAAQDQFNASNISYELSAQVKDINGLDHAIDEATGLFRNIRKLRLNQDNNFFITKSDNMAQTLVSLISYVRSFAIFIGLITLLGASVGLTNIMLVSVKERTREIGVRKALGASFITIRNQFLWESVVITQIGGLFGILSGLVLGNVVAHFISGNFIMPWVWIISGVILCILVGIFAGLYPAIKAARLDPIESLRYE
jgi:putative ABC transport system permease protein